jgi:hypothetical protein
MATQRSLQYGTSSPRLTTSQMVWEQVRYDAMLAVQRALGNDRLDGPEVAFGDAQLFFNVNAEYNDP